LPVAVAARDPADVAFGFFAGGVGFDFGSGFAPAERVTAARVGALCFLICPGAAAEGDVVSCPCARLAARAVGCARTS
jgi:hypothetical protein